MMAELSGGGGGSGLMSKKDSDCCTSGCSSSLSFPESSLQLDSRS